MGTRDLVLVVLGRDDVGKSSLVAHIVQSLSPSPIPSAPPVGSPVLTRLPSNGYSASALPPAINALAQSFASPARTSSRPHRPLPLYVRNARAAVSALLRRVRKLRLRHRPTYAVHVVPAPQESGSTSSDGDEEPAHWHVIDTPLTDLSFVARSHLPDVLLYVARLDDSRAMKADRLVMAEAQTLFGSRLWKRTIFVLTHGQALPPKALTYAEFLRGRRDALWRNLTSVVPPVPRDIAQQPSRSGERPVRRRLLLMASSEMEEGDRYGASAGTTGSSLDTPGSVSGGDESQGANVTSVSSSPSGEETSSESDIFYDDPPVPSTIVVELADSCPRNESGEKILPDGSTWMPALLAGIRRVADSAESGADDAVEEDTCGIYRDPTIQVKGREIIRQTFRRGSVLFLLQMVLSSIVIRSIRLANRLSEERDQRVRSRRSDVVCELSDEEYLKLTTKDPPADRTADGLDDTETFFFGRGSNQGRSPPAVGADRTNTEENKARRRVPQ